MTDFEEISTASVDPLTALATIRRFFDQPRNGLSESDVAETTYEVLRNVVWQLVSGRSAEEVLGWADVVLRVRQLLRVRKSAIAERLTTLYDLLEQTDRFQSMSAVRNATTHKHVDVILEHLNGAGAPMPRAVLAKRTGLKASNLSRILTNLVVEGLIKRIPRQREVFLALTDAGLAKASPAAARGHLSPKWDLDSVLSSSASKGPARSILRDTWGSTGAAVAVWDKNESLVSCDDAFASLFASFDAVALEGLPKSALAKRLSPAIAADLTSSTSTGHDRKEVMTRDGRILSIVERSGPSGSIWLGTDVSDYCTLLEASATRERALRRQLEDAGKRRVVAKHGLKPELDWLFHLMGDNKRGLMGNLAFINSHAELMRRTVGGKIDDEHYQVLTEAIAQRAEETKAVMADIMSVSYLLEDDNTLKNTTIAPRQLITDVLKSTLEKANTLGVSLSLDPSTEGDGGGTPEVARASLYLMVDGLLPMVPTGGQMALTASRSDGELIFSAKTGNSLINLMPPAHWNMFQFLIGNAGGRCQFVTGTVDGTVATLAFPIPPRGRSTRARPRN